MCVEDCVVSTRGSCLVLSSLHFRLFNVIYLGTAWKLNFEGFSASVYNLSAKWAGHGHLNA